MESARKYFKGSRDGKAPVRDDPWRGAKDR